MYSIGEVSRQTGVKVPTIRYYEQSGLMSEPDRSEGNQRRYGKSDVERLVFIRHARDLGLSIEAIRDLITLSGHPEQPCSDAHRIASEHLSDVRVRIERLKRLEAELEHMVSACDGHRRMEDCQVIRSLADHAHCLGEH